MRSCTRNRPTTASFLGSAAVGLFLPKTPAPLRLPVHVTAEHVHGKTLTLSTGRLIPTRWVGEQHVREDLGFIPSFADWARSIRAEPWMGRTQKIEAEVDPHLVMPVLEVS